MDTDKPKSPFKFDLPTEQSQIIKVIGVGGGGSNAVNHMYEQGIKGVDFLVCNTDSQALDLSPVPTKIQLGGSLTSGRGAGSNPEVGKNAAVENIDDVNQILENNTVMLFVTAGMGGGTGTGAAPVIATRARELGILTVGIVTMPFMFEGRRRRDQAEAGIKAMREAVDTLLVIRNERLREIYGNLSVKNAFAKADDILTTASKGIAELISVTGFVNVDMNDVISVMKDSGVAIMGQASAEGDDRAVRAVEAALESPLLNDNDISGAQNILLNITYGEEEVMMDEIGEITDYVQEAAGSTADVIFGYGFDEKLGKELSVTVIATGFEAGVVTPGQEPKQNKIPLEEKSGKAQEASHKGMSNPWDPVPQQEESDPNEPYLKSGDAQEGTKEPQSSTEEGSASRERQDENYEMDEPYLKPRQEDEASQPPAKGPEAPSDQGSSEASNKEEKRVYTLNEDQLDESESGRPDLKRSQPSPEEMQKRAAERINKVREMQQSLSKPGGLSELENEPAYRRRNVKLDNTPHSSESSMSRYTLSEDEDDDGERRTELRQNNSYLHDNVD